MEELVDSEDGTFQGWTSWTVPAGPLRRAAGRWVKGDEQPEGSADVGSHFSPISLHLGWWVLSAGPVRMCPATWCLPVFITAWRLLTLQHSARFFIIGSVTQPMEVPRRRDHVPFMLLWYQRHGEGLAYGRNWINVSWLEMVTGQLLLANSL